MPVRQVVNCKRTFASSNGSPYYAVDVHDKVRHPCPFAKQYNCAETFSNKWVAIHHASCHPKSFPCPVAERYRCNGIFTGEASAHRHGSLHDIGAFVSPLAEEHSCKRVFAMGIML